MTEDAVARGGRVISVPRTVSLLREANPAWEHSDEELAQIVAMVAIRMGRDLSFIR